MFSWSARKKIRKKMQRLSLIESFHMLELRNEEMTIKKKIIAGS